MTSMWSGSSGIYALWMCTCVVVDRDVLVGLHLRHSSVVVASAVWPVRCRAERKPLHHSINQSDAPREAPHTRVGERYCLGCDAGCPTQYLALAHGQIGFGGSRSHRSRVRASRIADVPVRARWDHRWDLSRETIFGFAHRGSAIVHRSGIAHPRRTPGLGAGGPAPGSVYDVRLHRQSMHMMMG